jgi:hypothetical protein
MSTRSPILDDTAPVAPYVPGSNPYLLRTESNAAGRSILAVTGTPAADRVPYFSSSSVVGLATLTAAGRTLIGLASSAALVTLAGTSPSIVGTNLLQLAAPVSTLSYMKVRHNLDNEVTYLTPAEVLSDIGAVSDVAYDATAWSTVHGVAPSKAAVRNALEDRQPYDLDLATIANLGGTNTIYYRSGGEVPWQPVTIGENLRFVAGVLSFARAAAIRDGAGVLAIECDGRELVGDDGGTIKMSWGGLAAPHDVVFNVPIRLAVYTVATLPASPVQGDTAMVTDAAEGDFGVTVTNGGTFVRPVYYDGTNWKVG